MTGNKPHAELPDGAIVVVVGGGPTGALFAIQTVRRVRLLGRKLDLRIVEKKKELRFYQTVSSVSLRAGCSFVPAASHAAWPTTPNPARMRQHQS